MKESIAVCIVALMFLTLGSSLHANAADLKIVSNHGDRSSDSIQTAEFSTSAPATIALVPEPATIVLLGCGGFLLLPRKQN
ncbi:MAG: PEP-CTERM sorting domain-containing protein [Sedimentisphaerales bacterium]|nr:PEP-CTERM sorting domain-containing protein [Sedimentisphaerales bacterium]